MSSCARSLLLGCLLGAGLGGPAPAADTPPYQRQEDVIYGRKFGTALTMDVFTPLRKANGAAIVLIVSAGWCSAHVDVNADWPAPLTRRGYTVFTVVHGSQPRYTLADVAEDLHRAVRFIRHHARRFGIDPNRIGIVGGSAGGHLSLLLGSAGREGDPNAKDPVDRASSRVQAVACWFPATDFLNWGSKGQDVRPRMPDRVKPAFAFEERVPGTEGFERIKDEEKIRSLLRELSPITHVSAQSAPTFILHGDRDLLVPLQQSTSMVAALEKASVPARLSLRPGWGHGWPDMDQDLPIFADWFDRYLLQKSRR